MTLPRLPFLLALLALLALGFCSPIPAPAATTCLDATRHATDKRDMAERAGAYFGLPAGLLPVVIDRETGGTWDPLALSPKGARGLGQVMPSTVAWKMWRRVGTQHELALIDVELRTPRTNLCWSARILRDALRICSHGGEPDEWAPEEISCALAGYAAGESVAAYVAWINERRGP